MPKFTEEEYREIENARARLQAYKDKICPYPYYPGEPIEPQPSKETPSENRLYDKLQQAEGKLLYLQNKLNEHLDKKRKVPKYK